MRPSAKATVYSHGTATCAEIYLTNEIPDNHHFLESLNQIQELVMDTGTAYLIDEAEDFFGPVTNETETGPSKRGNCGISGVRPLPLFGVSRVSLSMRRESSPVLIDDKSPIINQTELKISGQYCLTAVG